MWGGGFEPGVPAGVLARGTSWRARTAAIYSTRPQRNRFYRGTQFNCLVSETRARYRRFSALSSSPAQTFAGKILKTQRSSKMFFFARNWSRNMYKFIFVWIVMKCNHKLTVISFTIFYIITKSMSALWLVNNEFHSWLTNQNGALIWLLYKGW